MFNETSSIDELFQRHSIVELRSFSSKIQAEISSKKSVLRISVGEKFRDVIEAANSIKAMEGLVVEYLRLLEGDLSLPVSCTSDGIVKVGSGVQVVDGVKDEGTAQA